MQAQDILKHKGGDVISISDSSTLDDAINTLSDRNIGAVVVLDSSGRLCGILSERDIIHVLNGAPTGFRETVVANVMTREVITAEPTTSVDELLVMMTERRFRHLPIMKDGVLLGLVSIGDVVKHRIREAINEAEALKDYIAAG